jgi:hypothetical protein
LPFSFSKFNKVTSSIFKLAILPYYHLVLSTDDIVYCERASLLEKVLGSSKVQPNFRVTLIRKVQKKLNVKVGDIVIYVEDEKGSIIVKKGQLKPIS